MKKDIVNIVKKGKEVYGRFRKLKSEKDFEKYKGN